MHVRLYDGEGTTGDAQFLRLDQDQRAQMLRWLDEQEGGREAAFAELRAGAAAMAAINHRTWFFERLELDDGGVLAAAVLIETESSTELAVPIGAGRRSGSCKVGSADEGRRVVDALSKLPGFPCARFEPARGAGSDYVCWGDPMPALPADDAPAREKARWDITAGRLYGYTATAITQWVEIVHGREVLALVEREIGAT